RPDRRHRLHHVRWQLEEGEADRRGVHEGVPERGRGVRPRTRGPDHETEVTGRPLTRPSGVSAISAGARLSNVRFDGVPNLAPAVDISYPSTLPRMKRTGSE